MINADPNRTPTFAMFGNPDFFFQTSNPCTGRRASASRPAFAWNHGDIQQEIGNTWVGMVGPGVAQQRRSTRRPGPTTRTCGRRSWRSPG